MQRMLMFLFTQLFLINMISINTFGQAACCLSGNLITSAASDAFKAAHLSPLPVANAGKGQMVDLPVENGKNGRAYAIKASEAAPWILVFHEWWGLNNHIKNQADSFHRTHNVNVLAVDLYDGKLATVADSAAAYMTGLDYNRTNALMKAALSYVGGSKVITIGWCMGGMMSVHAALMGGEKILGCVTYYGLPDPEKTDLTKLKTDILGIFASKDTWIDAPMVKKFEAAMIGAGRELHSYWYNADHAFANPSNPNYNAKAANGANAVVNGYLTQLLNKK